MNLRQQANLEPWSRSNRHHTCERELPFRKAVLFRLSLARCSSQVDLTAFMRSFSNRAMNIAGCAFLWNREKTDPLLIKGLLQAVNRKFCTDSAHGCG